MRKSYIIFLVLLTGLFTSCTAQNDKKIQPASLSSQAMGIDLRTAMELKLNAAPGALHIPISDLQNSTQLPRDKNTPIYVFCESGGRSAKAKKILEAQSYTQIIDIKDWRTWNKLQKAKQ